MAHTLRVSLEPAWILHQRPYRDSSLLLEVFSRTHGRVVLVARGARSSRSRWQGLLQIMRPLALSWSQRGELGTLTGADGRGQARRVPGREVLCGCYLNELLLRLMTRNDPHPDSFDRYEQALGTLAGNEEQALRVFEKQLLQSLGYGLLLDCEFDSGAAVRAEHWYEYQLERGPVRLVEQQPGLCLQGSSLLALHRNELTDAQACREAKQLMRAALALYLGARPLRTREVLRQLSTLARERPQDTGAVTLDRQDRPARQTG